MKKYRNESINHGGSIFLLKSRNKSIYIGGNPLCANIKGRYRGKIVNLMKGYEKETKNAPATHIQEDK